MEKFFSKPRLIIGIILGITVFFSTQLFRAQIDNNNYRFIPAHDDARITAERINDLFGSQITILVGLERQYGSIFDSDFLKQLQAYDKRVLDLPLVDAAVSIISTDYITGRDGAIIVEPLVDSSFMGTPDEIDLLKSRLRSWDMYDRMLVSDDGTATQIVIALNVPGDQAGSPETLATFAEIKKIAQDVFSDSGTQFYITGIPVFSAEINASVLKDLIYLVPLVILIVLLTLFFSFRRFFAVLVPIITVIIAVIWSVGSMPFFGIKLSILTTILPVILVAVGSAYGIHVVSHYIDAREQSGTISKEEHKELVFALVRRIGKPVFLAALTTFAGFISFCFTSVVPIREFGYFASFGVIVAFVVAITMIPSLFLVRGPVPLKPRKGLGKPLNGEEDVKNNHVDSRARVPIDPLSQAITTSFMGLIKGKRKILIFTVLVCIISAILIPRIVVDNVLVEYFHADSTMARSDTFIRKYFGGSKTVSVVIESSEPGGVLDPDVLVAMDGLATFLETKVPEVGKVTSFTHMIKRINQVYNAEGSEEDFVSLYQNVEPLSGADSDWDTVDTADSFDTFGFGFGFSEEAAKAPLDGASDKLSSSYKSEPHKLESPFASLSQDTTNLSIKDVVRVISESEQSLVQRDPAFVRFMQSLKRYTNYDAYAYYEIPSDPKKYGQKDKEGLKQVISNYMMLLSGDISAFADDPLEPKAIQMTVQMRTTGQLDTDRVLEAIHGYSAFHFPPSVRVTVGGFALVEGALNKLVVQSQLISIIISLFVVFLILSVAYRSFVAGIIGIVPLSLAILLNFAAMALLGIKLNIGTALVASVAIGTGVDYTIHYIETYYREWRAMDGKPGFLERSYETSGKAILINALSVGLGFGVLAFSQFNILAQFGLLIAFTMATSSLSALITLPVLLNWIRPSFIYGHLENSRKI